MEKIYRLEFISKRPSALKIAWRALIDAGLLTSNLGVLTGSFLAQSAELSRVLDSYERDKAALDVRMESSCQTTYEPNELNLYAVFKLYPPDVELVYEERRPQTCEECGRAIGCCHFGSLVWAMDALVPNCAVVMTREGDVLLRNDLLEQIQELDGLDEYQLNAVADPNGSANWSVVMRAPVLSRVGDRVGFCRNCGGAVKSEALPEVDEVYSGNADRNFMLSPDKPGLPCFSKALAHWTISASPCISWEHFKPVDLQTA